MTQRNDDKLPWGTSVVSHDQVGNNSTTNSEPAAHMIVECSSSTPEGSVLLTNRTASDNVRDDTTTNTTVATSRTNRAPPTWAFFRGALLPQNQSICTPSMDERQDNPHPIMQHRDLQNESSLDEDLTVSLIPQSLPNIQLPYSILPQSLLDPETWASLRRTIRRSGNYIAYCTLLAMLILVPTVLYRSLRDRKLDIAAIHSARVMVCGTVIMSMRLVYLHLTHWFMPDVQKYVVRILWMVPIYAIQSYLSLRYHHARVYMCTIRDFYEAFVIASFVYFLVELLGGQESLVQLLRHKDPVYGQHKFPISLVLQPWELGEEFMLQCKHGVLQYVLFKTSATVLIFLCEFAGVYGEGHFEWFVAYPYLCFFQNISVMYALYCLVIFFHACHDELHHPVNWHPLGKFLCIKGVVFFTWWQGVVIFYLRDHGIIAGMGPWSSIDVANGFIDYCIVVEMVFFAIAHSYTFTYTEYLPGRLPQALESSTNGSRAGEDGVLGRRTTDDLCTLPQSQQRYRPPATLCQPMRFRDALWSSTVPHETLQDLQRLRSGVDSVMNLPSRSRGISLADMTREDVHGDPESAHPLPRSEDFSFV
jgi:Organic solute transporter Ostalpha